MVNYMETKLTQIDFKLYNGHTTTLSDFGDKVMLVVNVASQCGLTPQYEGLEKIYQKYHQQGFLVIGFPSNEFAGQEPGTDAEIQTFCQSHYGVKFPVMGKIVVKGPQQHPLYKLLTEEKPIATKKTNSVLEPKLKEKGLFSGKPGEIMWNFEKFLINRHGEVVERFAPDITPEDPIITKAIERELSN